MTEYNEPKPRYKPIKVSDATAYDPMQGTHHVKRVTFVLADGTSSYVDIPKTEYGPDAVQAALEHEATLHEQVMGITP